MRKSVAIACFILALLTATWMYLRAGNEQLWGHLPLALYLFSWATVTTFAARNNDPAADRRLLLSTASGLLLGLGFPGYLPLPFLLLVAWVPLLLLQRETTSARTIFRHGLNTFALYNILATFWVTNTGFGAGLFAIFANSFLMCIPWLAFHFTSRATPKVACLSLIAYWVAFENFHYHWSLNWPWLTLGNGFAQWPSLVQWYELTGTLGGSAWILAINWLVLKWYLSPGPRKIPVYLTLAVFIPLAASLIRYHTYPPPSESEATITVSSVQPNLEPHYEKFDGDTESQLAIFTRLSREAIQASRYPVDYLLLPETSFSQVEEDRATSAPALAALMDGLPPDRVRYLVTGTSSYHLFGPGEPLTEAVRYYPTNDGSEVALERLNGAVQIDLENQDFQTYRKGVFVPGAESFPFKNVLFFLEPLVNSLGGTVAGYGTQEKRTPLVGERARIAPVICYESVFGEYFTDYIREGAQAVFVMTNDGWWDNTSGHRQHLYFSSLRAIETRRAVVRSANMGSCAFIDQRGHIVSRTHYGERGFLNGTLTLNDAITPYVRYGDLLSRVAWLLAVMALLSGIARTLRRRAGVVFLCCISSIWAGAQVQRSVTLSVAGSDAPFTDRIPNSFQDSTEVQDYLADWQQKMRERAHWEASVDTLVADDEAHFRAVVHLGPAYSWSSMTLPADADVLRWARRSGYRDRRFGNGRRLSLTAWYTVRDSLISRAAREGFPFASVALTDIEWESDGALSARVDMNKGAYIRVGEVRVPEGVRIRNIFLQRYLGLVPGEAYSQRRVRRMQDRIAQLPYVTMSAPAKVSFRDSLAYLDLPLQRRPASRFDFVIGVLPNSQQNDGKLLITGELNGELYNGFGQGERIAARFEQLKPQTQELQLGVDYPFLFGLPFGFEGELELYRRDTSFLNLNSRLAATYLREGNDRLSAFWEQRTTIVPGLDSARLVNGLLPDTLGVNRSFFGLQLRRTRTDRRFSPRNGYTIDVSAAAGFRRIRNLEFTGEVADSLTQVSTQFQFGAAVDFYFEPLVGTVIYLGLHARALVTDRSVLTNEQYRIGGARILRGFDEQQLFATDYELLTAEFRLLLGENAFLYTFVDAARLNQRSSAKPDLPIDYPLGLGVGVNFETRAGIFGLSLAVGKRRNDPFDLGAPKVHLGYVSVF